MTTRMQAFGRDWGPFADLELALLRRPVPWGAGIPAGAELSGRGYRRPPVGPVLESDPINPAHWRNALPILWPDALDDWGPADTLAAVLPPQGGYVLATTPLLTGFKVRQGDQVQIMRYAMDLLAVPPDTDRPYGTDFYNNSFYGLYPPDGEVFAISAALSLAWMRQSLPCAAWASAPAIVSGGCQ
jgi:hypothetical protein